MIRIDEIVDYDEAAGQGCQGAYVDALDVAFDGGVLENRGRLRCSRRRSSRPRSRNRCPAFLPLAATSRASFHYVIAGQCHRTSSRTASLRHRRAMSSNSFHYAIAGQCHRTSSPILHVGVESAPTCRAEARMASSSAPRMTSSLATRRGASKPHRPSCLPHVRVPLAGQRIAPNDAARASLLAIAHRSVKRNVSRLPTKWRNK